MSGCAFFFQHVNELNLSKEEVKIIFLLLDSAIILYKNHFWRQYVETGTQSLLQKMWAFIWYLVWVSLTMFQSAAVIFPGRPVGCQRITMSYCFISIAQRVLFSCIFPPSKWLAFSFLIDSSLIFSEGFSNECSPYLQNQGLVRELVVPVY